MTDNRQPAAGLEWLYQPLNEIQAYRGLLSAVREKGVYSVYGLDDTQRLHAIAGIQRAAGRTLLFITSTDQSASRAHKDLDALLGGGVALFNNREISLQKVAAASQEMGYRRIEALGAAALNELRAVVATVDALVHWLMPVKNFLNNIIYIESNMRVEPSELIERLIAMGYERVDMVEGRGQCALRGGLLDVYPVGQVHAVRVEFFDTEIDSLREFDVLSQRSIGKIDKVRLFPAREAILTDEQAQAAAGRLRAELRDRANTSAGEKADRQHKLEEEFGLPPWDEFEREISDEDELPELNMIGKPRGAELTGYTELERRFMPMIEALEHNKFCPMAEVIMPYLYEERSLITDYIPEAIIALDQPERLKERCENRALEFREQLSSAIEREAALEGQAALLAGFDELVERMTARRVITLNPFMRSQREELRAKALFKFDGLGAAGYHGNIKDMARDVRGLKKDNWRVALLSGGAARGQRLRQLMDDMECSAAFMDGMRGELEPGAPVILPFSLSKGFTYQDVKFAVLAETDIYGISRQKSRSTWRAGEKLSAFTDLSAGDYVVHEQHGVGQYMGTVRLQVDGAYGDYLHIRYEGSDKLYVPTDQLDRVQKFIGAEGGAPRVNKLSGAEWQRQKARVKAGIREIAGDLVKLYAERQTAPGFAFSPDTPWQRQFEDNFDFEETEDQVQAIEEIKLDMQSATVMDRLLCGDVGYGKTEVALRAMFKAVMDGKQAALLAPTTILVQQHFATMRKRFDGFPISFDTLSRFKTAAEQRAALDALKSGRLDIIIGTHRLLGKDVKYKDLGLLVVDEEQRFGVKHKESIKQLKRSIDVLTLSATPIPRTLHMSMVGVRDMSILRTPPEERYPIQTYVVEYSDALLRDAILREKARGGQAFVLYNRVMTIERFYERLSRLVPEAKVAIGHGQMSERALENVMLDFFDGKYDVLLCTTIIEAGLDVSDANTLVVIDSDRFGLAQLYQLRGRVGRSNRLAYAYLTVQPNKVLTETADKRLTAIREFTEFGSGFRVAMRDLEIRGAGNLLGAEQSGHMASVGYDLYIKMIEETVRELRGDFTQGDIVTRVEARIDAFLPAEYVPNDQLRIEAYKRIAAVESRETREDIIDEMIDRFGSPPRPVMNLIDVAHLKGLCGRIGIEVVSAHNGRLIMKFSPKASLDVHKLLDALERNKQSLTLQAGDPPSLAYREYDSQPIDDLIRRSVPIMEDVVKTVLS